MRLKNKKTGEIIDDGYVRETYDFQFDGQKHVLAVFKSNGHRPPERVSGAYTSLAELNSEWEDYKEPEGIVKVEQSIVPTCVYIVCSTEEEAKLAIRKLEAWTRLKDKGFRFNGWTIPEEPKSPHIKLLIEAEMDVPDSPYDLDLLFCTETNNE